MKVTTKFAVALCVIVASAFIPAAARAQDSPETIVEVRANIDGRSRLILRGDTVQWYHLDFAAPGRELFTNYPTTINGVDWYPVWPDRPDAENRDCNCFSIWFRGGLSPALPAQPMEVSVQVLSVVRPDAPDIPPGTVTVIQFPVAENSFTTVVEFDDNPQGGSAFYDIKLRFRTLPVIDIKPGDALNSINPKSKGVIPVAILTTRSFDAGDVVRSSVFFGAGGTEAAAVSWSLEDVDGDGDADMLFHFKTPAAGIVCGETSARLEGETRAGKAFAGTDSIRTVGCK